MENINNIAQQFMTQAAWHASRSKQKAAIDAMAAALDYYAADAQLIENKLQHECSKRLAGVDVAAFSDAADQLMAGLKYGKRLLGDSWSGVPALYRVMRQMALVAAAGV